MGDILVDEERDHAGGHHAYQVRLKTLVESNSSLVSAMRSNRNTEGGELVNVAMGLSYLQCLRAFDTIRLSI